MLRLLLDREHRVVVVELDDAVRRGLADVVGEDVPAAHVGQAAQGGAQAGAVEDVVAEHQGHAVVADEVGADHEGLGQPVRAGLHRVGELDAPLPAVTQQPLELLGVLGRGDDQHLADAGHHQRRQRVVDHRLVVDRHELLGDAPGDGVQPRARAPGQDDALHGGEPNGARHPHRAGIPLGAGYPVAHEGSRHRWGRFHRQQLRPPHPRHPSRRRGDRARRAHLCGLHGIARRCDGPDHLRRGGRGGCRAGRPARRRRRRRRALRGRVAQRQLARRPQPLRAHQPDRHLHPARGRAPARRALPPHLDRRGLRRPRARRPQEVHRGHPLQPELALLLDQGGLRPAGAGLGALVRAAGHDLELLEQLRPAPARREVHPAAGHQRHRRHPAQALRGRAQRARLDPRRRPQRGRLDDHRQGRRSARPTSSAPTARSTTATSCGSSSS